jgi:hypothetical protein
MHADFRCARIILSRMEAMPMIMQGRMTAENGNYPSAAGQFLFDDQISNPFHFPICLKTGLSPQNRFRSG